MLTIILLLAQQAQAQDTARGAQIFAQSCAVGYCHGTAGAANRGPRLAGRGLDRPFIEKVIRDGVSGTAMPGFKSLPAADLNAVIEYVAAISGGSSTAAAAVPTHVPSPAPPRFNGPPEAAKGKDLFFDPVRGTRCGTCHAVEDWGTPVGPNLTARPPANAAAIRQATNAHVQSATAGKDKFPALLVERKGGNVVLYDLSSTPPSMRTFPEKTLTLSPGTSWKHANALAGYSDSDLNAVAAYLNWAASPH